MTKTEDRRVIFAIPWLGRMLAGTTDAEAGLQDEMVVTRGEAVEEYVYRIARQMQLVGLQHHGGHIISSCDFGL